MARMNQFITIMFRPISLERKLKTEQRYLEAELARAEAARDSNERMAARCKLELDAVRAGLDRLNVRPEVPTDRLTMQS